MDISNRADPGAFGNSAQRNAKAMYSERAKKRAGRIGCVLLGILTGQLILYGASFAGEKILLPLDILALPKRYIPMQPGQYSEPLNVQGNISDPIYEDEPARLFRYAELRAGRLPIWNPYQYAGVPCVSFLSPFAIFGALVRSPRILPWLALVLALVSGLGVYLFSRRVLQVGVWPATIAAWCYPVTGFFVFWQSSSLPHPVVWLPWILYAIHAVLSGSGRWSLGGLALTTMLTLISGHLDMAGLVLIVGGLFAVWDFFFVFHGRVCSRDAFRPCATVIAGWILGFMLASPELLPALDYAQTGSRLQNRRAGEEERPPIGLVSLPQLLLPDVYGTQERNSLAMLPEKETDLVETPAAGFTGLIAAFVIAPLAWGSRRHRSVTIFFAAIALLGLAWCLNLPGVVWVMRIPPLNMLSYNRFVFATSFAILALAAIGLEESSSGSFRWQRVYYVPIAILVAIAAWCVFRAFVLPDEIAKLPQAIAAGHSVKWVQDAAGVHRVQSWFSRMYLSSAVVCLVALAAWIWLGLNRTHPRAATLLLGLLACSELLFFAHGRAGQCDPRLYYPAIPELDEIARSAPGRVLPYNCLPANLLQTQGLFEVRGYDGVDPARLVDLVDLAAAPDNVKLSYATVQFFVPKITDGPVPGTVQLPPVLDLLGVRYLIMPNQEDTRYYVFANNSALPRAFVPRSVEVEADPTIRLRKLADPLFDPRQVAYVEEAVDFTPPSQGEAAIFESTSQRITVKATMARTGLVVLADQWNAGWRAYIDGKQTPILRVDHALRGVVAPAGESTIVFRYQPASLQCGLGAMFLAILTLTADFCLRLRARK